MATDVAAVLANLLAFYEFDDRTMISVGAGGGQLAGYGRVARKVIAVDPDGAALAALAERTRALGIEDRFVLLEKDFMAVSERAEVVLFEFCLHEIPDHDGALVHAATLAPDIVVIDHAPGSPWAHVVDETEKVAASWATVSARGVRRAEDHHTVQHFASYQELFDKVKGQGAEAIRRIERWRGCADITIPMAYKIALL
jgi:predicted RNA methylase